MKIADVRKLDQAGLGQKLTELKEEEFNLRMQAATGQINNPRGYYTIKRDIAKVKTVLTEMQNNIVSVSKEGN